VQQTYTDYRKGASAKLDSLAYMPLKDVAVIDLNTAKPLVTWGAGAQMTAELEVPIVKEHQSAHLRLTGTLDEALTRGYIDATEHKDFERAHQVGHGLGKRTAPVPAEHPHAKREAPSPADSSEARGVSSERERASSRVRAAITALTFRPDRPALLSELAGSTRRERRVRAQSVRSRRPANP